MTVNPTAPVICSDCGKTVQRIVLLPGNRAVCQSCATHPLFDAAEETDVRSARTLDQMLALKREMDLTLKCKKTAGSVSGPLFETQGGLF